MTKQRDRKTQPQKIKVRSHANQQRRRRARQEQPNQQDPATRDDHKKRKKMAQPDEPQQSQRREPAKGVFLREKPPHHLLIIPVGHASGRHQNRQNQRRDGDNDKQEPQGPRQKPLADLQPRDACHTGSKAPENQCPHACRQTNRPQHRDNCAPQDKRKMPGQNRNQRPDMPAQKMQGDGPKARKPQERAILAAKRT